MKKVLTVLIAAAMLVIAMGVAALGAGDAMKTECFRYEPNTGRIVGSFVSDAIDVAIYLDHELKHFEKLNVPVAEGAHLVEVYEEGVLVYSQIIEVTAPTPVPTQTPTSGEYGLDFNWDGVVGPADAAVCLPGHESGGGHTVYDAVRVLRSLVGLKSE